MRKFLLCMLATTALLCAKAQETEPVTIEQDGMTFIVTGETTAGLKSPGEVTIVNIPETVSSGNKTYTVTSIETYAFNYNSTATKVVMPNTITEIKDFGMYGASAVTEIVVSEKLRTLGNSAFYGCEVLPSINLPEGITEIPSSCFFRSTALKAITLPSTVKVISSGAFYKSGLTEFTFPASCDSTGNNLFQLCPDLTKVTFNANIRVLGTGVIQQCPKLTTVDMSQVTKLETLPADLFNACSALSGTFTIPSCVKELESNVFGKTAISEFKVAEGNNNLVVIDEALYSADKRLLYAFPPKATKTELTVADGCIGISGGTFNGGNIEKVTLPEGMRAFDAYAFCESQLKEINFPSSLIFMGNQALAATQLTNVVLPENLVYINEGLMAGCEQLTDVTIPSSVIEIGSYAFYNCSSLTKIRSLGTEAAELSYYEGYDHPFAGISSEAVLSVPKGSIDSYESEYWDEYITSIIDTEFAIFEHESASPAEGTEMETLEKVLITFPEEVTIAVAQPNIRLIEGDELTGKLIEPDSHWLITDEKNNTVGIVGQDYDSFNQAFNLKPGENYCFIIPAGTFKNANGDENQRIVLHYIGLQATPFSYESVNPADGTKLKEISVIELTFEQPVTIIDDAPSIEWSLTTGSTTAPTSESGWSVADNSTDGKTMTLTPDAPIGLEPLSTYMLRIPAGLFKDAEGNPNSEITLTYHGEGNTGICSMITDNCLVLTKGNEIDVRLGSLQNCDIRLYDVTGQLLQVVENTSGNVLLNNDSNGVLLINIHANGVSHTFKVVK